MECGAMGIYHEAYEVFPGHYENIYGNMPAQGIGKVSREKVVHYDSLPSDMRTGKQRMAASVNV